MHITYTHYLYVFPPVGPKVHIHRRGLKIRMKRLEPRLRNWRLDMFRPNAFTQSMISIESDYDVLLCMREMTKPIVTAWIAC